MSDEAEGKRRGNGYSAGSATDSESDEGTVMEREGKNRTQDNGGNAVTWQHQ